MGKKQRKTAKKAGAAGVGAGGSAASEKSRGESPESAAFSEASEHSTQAQTPPPDTPDEDRQAPTSAGESGAGFSDPALDPDQSRLGAEQIGLQDAELGEDPLENEDLREGSGELGGDGLQGSGGFEQGSEGFNEGSKGFNEDSKGFNEDSEALNEDSEGLNEDFKSLNEDSESLLQDSAGNQDSETTENEAQIPPENDEVPENGPEVGPEVPPKETKSTQGQSLLQARQSESSAKFGSKDLGQQQAIRSGAESIKNTFRDIKNTIGHLPPELFGSKPIDWEFWAQTVEDYHAVVQNQQEQLQAAVAAGIPTQIRGIIWQLVAQSKNLNLEELYLHLKTEPSAHEKAIKRDLSRTSFYSTIEAAGKSTELYNILAAYSNFDPDVGYTQGMVFIVVPLIMNMTEAEGFCLLVTLMKEYGLRQLFSPQMRGLHLLLYQYDRLLEQNSPLLYNHMCVQGVQSSMYASQWFLTFFSYKFPLDVVLRIFDMIITQGVEAVLRLGLNLVLRNESHLLRLPFDALLDFLKTSLVDVYTCADDDVQENKRFSLLSLKAAQKKTEYRLDAFITDSMSVAMSPRQLALFSAEFDDIMALDVSRTDDIASVRAHNDELRSQISELEAQYADVDSAHSEHVSRLVAVKLKLPEIVNEITSLREAVTSLEAKVQALDSGTADLLPEEIEAKVHSLLGQNAEETERFAALDEEFNRLQLEEEKLDEVLKANKKWFW